MLGERFLLLKHTGRKTGRQRQTVLEVMRHDTAEDRYIVCSAWGEASEWYNNLQRIPQAQIVVRGRRMKATATRIPIREAEHEIQRYALSHPSAYRWIRETLLGREANKETNDFSSLGSRVPVMSLQVRSETGSLMRLRIIDVAGEHVRWPKQGRVGYLLPSAIRRAGFVWIVRAMVSLVLGVESGNAREPELSDTSIARGRTEAGFSYMTGGLISDEQRAMERKSRPYNLKVVIASHLRPFISPVLLLIANNQSGRIEKVVLYAPWLYVQLPSGGYTIAARIENRIVLIRDIYLREDRRATFVLR